MLRRLAKWLPILAVVGICAATPISIDYTTGAPNANQGASMTYGVLTITARTGMTGSYDPLFGGGSAGTIYWGDLGDLDDPDCGQRTGPKCIGLGVQTAKAGGSKGISGEGGDQDEALVFSWTGGIPADQLKILLVGLNTGNKADILDLYLEWYPSNGSPSDKTVLPYDISGIATAPSWLDFSTIPGTAGMTLASVAVTARGGHFGVGGLWWDEGGGGGGGEEIPEPAAMFLVGAGMCVLALRARLTRIPSGRR